MSAEATAYVTALRECPDGAQLSTAQKALLWCLADHHNRSTRRCDPSLTLLIEESLLSRSTLKAHLDYLEKHAVIEQHHPQRQGRGMLCSYVFLFLDDPARLQWKLQKLAEGVNGRPLFADAKGVGKGVEKDPKRGQEGVDLQQRNKEEPGTKREPEELVPAQGADTDPRHKPIREHIQATHATMNGLPRSLVPWDGFEGKVLAKLLAAHADMTVEQARRCVDHYYLSDVNISQRPAKFIPHLMDYWIGPLNQYGTPRHFDKQFTREQARAAEASVGMA